MRNDRRKNRKRDVGGKRKDEVGFGLRSSLYAAGIILLVRYNCIFCNSINI